MSETQAGTPHFGARVVGHEAYEKAVREQKGGVHVFGKRVRDAISGDGPTSEAKRASEFGIKVVDHASFQDAEGKKVSAIAVDDIVNILAENPTFFDSLYEAELARDGGARPDALQVFLMTEIGIKGAGREEIIREIRGLLGEKAASAAARADLAKAQSIQGQEQAQREEENKLLGDAERVKALAERAENLDKIKKSQSKGSKEQVVSASVESQVRQIADDEGLKLPGDGSDIQQGKVPAKPQGEVKVETQQPGDHILTPKSEPATKHAKKSTAKKASAKKSAKGAE